jgi:hypothetical protein
VCCVHQKYRPPVSYTDKVKRIELSRPVGTFGEISDPGNGHVYRLPGYRGYAGLVPPMRPGSSWTTSCHCPTAAADTTHPPCYPKSAAPRTHRWPEPMADRPTAAPKRPRGPHHPPALPGHGQPPRMTLAEAQALYEPDWYDS